MSMKWAESTEAEEIIIRQGQRIAKLETALRLSIDRLEAVGTGRIDHGEAIAVADELKKLVEEEDE